jgi:hypothetical protein
MTWRRHSVAWLALGLVGIFARLGLWWFSIGSNDALIWNAHGLHVTTEGLAETYGLFRNFNHPPLMGLYAAQVWGPDLWDFARLIKLPGLFGEALTMTVLWRLAGPRTFAVYACLPAAILVSGYHASTDSLCAALVLVAAIAFDKERYFLSGVLWSAALNVKIIPLVLIPLAFLGVPNRRALWRLSAGFALGLAPFIPPALTAFGPMYRNMIAYNSTVENWGIMALLNRGIARPALAGFARPVWEWWLMAGRYIILLSIVGVALASRFHRRMAMIEQAALGTALFLILAPGFGVQYVVYPAALLCLVDLPVGIWWGWTSGVCIGTVYWLFLNPGMPLESLFWHQFPLRAYATGLLAWAVLVYFVWRHVRTGPVGTAMAEAPASSLQWDQT